MTTTSPSETSAETGPKKKARSVRHTRALHRDRSKRPTVAPPDEHVAKRLTDLVHPATLAQLDYSRHRGLREPILSLPVRVALVLSRIWRQIGGVCELVRLARSEQLLWLPPFHVTQQALSERLSPCPAELFLRILAANALTLTLHSNSNSSL